MNNIIEKECSDCHRPVFRSFYHTENDEEWLVTPIKCIECYTKGWLESKK